MPTLYIELHDQLGNQLYAYASAKCLALRQGYEFKFVTKESSLQNSVDQKRGSNVLALVSQSAHEHIQKLPDELEKVWAEPSRRKSNYFPELLKLSESILLKGHLQSYEYLAGYETQIRSWFVLDKDLELTAQARLKEIRQEAGEGPLLCVHYRCGKDYDRQSRIIDPDFYRRAISHIRASHASAKIILFSDDTERARELLGPEIEVFTSPGSLFEDLALMTHCQFHIVGNSTFAWWAAFLAKNEPSQVIRPSVFPINYGGYYPLDIFPPQWTTLPARRLRPRLSQLPRIYVGALRRWLLSK